MRHELKVNRKDLIDGLIRLKKAAKPKKNMEALLSFENGNFVVFINGVTIEADASGDFPGLVRMDASKAINLATVLPPNDPLTIGHDGARLYIGTFAMPCTWHSSQTPRAVRLPIDAPLPLLLGLRLLYSDEEIFQSGNSNLLTEAERKTKTLITKATNALEPLGVKRADVEKLVDQAVKQAKDNRSSSSRSAQYPAREG
jgi:hypothetical protein